jgi:predicted GNAT family acetyltransferase
MESTVSATVPEIRDNVERSRFELEVRGMLVFAAYRRQGSVLFIDWVEAARPLRGTGAAGRLMQGIADLARREGWTITPLCGYAAAWLRQNKSSRGLLT